MALPSKFVLGTAFRPLERSFSSRASLRVCSECRNARSSGPSSIGLPSGAGKLQRRYASVKTDPDLTQTNRAEVTLRRFWKTVHIKEIPEGFQVTLDHRNLKTPGGAKLIIPKDRRLLALLIANEWENQDEILKQHALPLTSLASRAIDGMQTGKIRSGVIQALMNYLETDTILFPDEKPDVLVRLQDEHWNPLRDWMKDEYGVQLRLAEGFAPAKQSQETREIMRAVLDEMNHWELAAFERAVYATKSFVTGLALCKGRLTAHQAAEAAHVEVRSQIERWGEVEDTHDVDYQDIRRALGSVSCLLFKA